MAGVNQTAESKSLECGGPAPLWPSLVVTTLIS
jgi:hypothetical protein